ncbi:MULTISPECIES: hypothetical protein [Streptomyces]|jgi:hypothetical protein|uniref:hypothetical protein n=1 Tax=Streptomyces TaxID=1883 RepID=UPI0003D7D2DB|nr:hypothetical protein [Streptomyces sp. F8]AHE40086.1 hypothetical protein pFRL5_423c [Streptomyces sp. F8]
MTFDEWAERLDQVYMDGTQHDWRDEDKTAWEEAIREMAAEFPHITITWMDPKCGCCTLDDPALLVFDDPRGPGGFELLYPTFRPTHTYYLG